MTRSKQKRCHSNEGYAKLDPGAENLVPGSQAWIYKFYYAFEKNLSRNQRSIIDAVLRGLGHPDDNLDASEASTNQKNAAKKIINSFVKRNLKVNNGKKTRNR